MNPNDIINQIFQQYLGRSPSAAEMQGFSQAIGSGYLDPIGLMSFVQSSAEYQQKQIPQIAQQYNQQLTPLMQQANTLAMNQGMDAAQGRFAQLGRPDSTGLASSFAQVAGQNAAQNSQFVGQNVGGYLGQAYGNMNPYAMQGYQLSYGGPQQAYRNFNYNRTLQADAAYQNSQNSIGTYGRQNAAFNNYAGLAGGLLRGTGSGLQSYYGSSGLGSLGAGLGAL